MKTQVIVIHGGTPFDAYEEYLEYLKSCELSIEKLNQVGWKDNLAASLGDDFEVLYPKMPNAKNPHYEEWQIWFEKLFPLLNGDVILVGHSLGGIFLTKYLSESNFPQKIKSLHLVAAPYDTEHVKESLGDFALLGPVNECANKVDKIFIYQSKDDSEVAYQDAEKYKRDLPNAIVRMFEDRGHFIQEQFPELVADIQSIG